jgi:hypothetical protein
MSLFFFVPSSCAYSCHRGVARVLQHLGGSSEICPGNVSFLDPTTTSGPALIGLKLGNTKYGTRTWKHQGSTMKIDLGWMGLLQSRQ